MSLVLAFVTADLAVTVDDVAVMTWQVTVTVIRQPQYARSNVTGVHVADTGNVVSSRVG